MVLVELDQDLEHLAYVDESEGARYDSKAVFSDLGLGVEIEQYDNFTLYTWEESIEFNELIDCIEPYFPFTEDPALEMVKEDSLVRNVNKDYDALSNEWVDDPVREWRGYDRWSDYSLIQINLNGAKVVWDDKKDESRVRVYEIEDVDVFEKLFPEAVALESAKEITEESENLIS